jgi:hypothetical protein
VTRRVTTLALSLALLCAAPAEAGQSYGALAPGSVITCVPNTIVVQFTGGNHVTGAGIVTKWSTTAPAPVAYPMRLVMLRVTSDPSYTVVGESSLQTIAAGMNTFATRIPVQAGDRIAVDGGACMFTSTNPSVHYCTACTGGTGDTVVLDQTELDRQVNARIFVEQDGDGDGWGDESQDNCLGLANPSQANADADGSGDDCDIDDDNDSVIDSEDAFPFDASESHDADADGVGDNADLDDDNDGFSDIDEARAGSDPRNATSRPSAPVSLLRTDLLFPPAEGKLAAPSLRAPASISLAKLRKGIRVSASTARPARLDFELRVTPRVVRVARFDLLLASRSLGVGSGRRSVRLKPNARALRGARFKLQLRVKATDLGGNRAVATRTISVR